MLYELHDVSVSLGAKTVLSHIDFYIRGTERIGIVGINGAGKTTLLRLIAGELDPDRDDKRQGPPVTQARALTMEMHQQHFPLTWLDETVEELALAMSGLEGADRFSKERYEWEQRFFRMFTGMGFTPEARSRKLSDFSGGQQTRIALICRMMSQPDVLLLDEPTNHLDMQAVMWLESWLLTYPKAVVIVSHDRYFLDRTAQVTWEVEDGKLTRYAGGYTAYREQKEKNRIAAQQAYARQQAEAERLDGLIRRFKNKPRKAAFARAKKTVLDRMEKLPPVREPDIHRFTEPIEPASLGSKWVLETKDLKIGYGKKAVCAPLELKVQRGQKIGVLGENGAGKTTLLATIAGRLPRISGKMTVGNGITIGYFDQQAAGLRSEKTVLEHFSARFPGMDTGQVRSRLAAWLFKGPAVMTRVNDLSGGEKSRLVLAELLELRPNFLILDEPTNHMDIPARETLESALAAYTGTLLFVSHDRYFIQKLADRLLLMNKEGQILVYPFGFEHYVNHLNDRNTSGSPALRSSKEQAMIDGLRAVPRSERHEVPMRSEEEAFLDWQLGLARQDMAAAEETYAAIVQKAEAAAEAEAEAALQSLGEAAAETMEAPAAETSETAAAAAAALEESLKSAHTAWTKACLAWYDIAKDAVRGRRWLC